jgi:hypothetical protein
MTGQKCSGYLVFGLLGRALWFSKSLEYSVIPDTLRIIIEPDSSNLIQVGVQLLFKMINKT